MMHSLPSYAAGRLAVALLLTPAITAVATEPMVIDLNHARLPTPAPCTGQNDAAVEGLYFYGELPVGEVPRQSVRALISNRGVLAQNNLPVSLAINGASTFMKTETAPPLAACGGQAVIEFPLFNMCDGNATIQVSVPSDDDAANNSLTRPIAITNGDYSYKHPGTTSTGGFGFNGSRGVAVAKFSVLPFSWFRKVKLEFTAASSTTYRVVVYDDAGDGTPSAAPLYVDSADRTVTAAGPVTIDVSANGSPVKGRGSNVFIGIEQTNTVNAQLAFDTETPVRSGSFFHRDASSSSWTDFAPGIDLKPNIGILLEPRASPAAQIAYSSKAHGSTGTFHRAFYYSTIEPRAGSGPGMGDHLIAIPFRSYSDTVSIGRVTVTSPTGGSAGPATATFDDDNVVSVQLTGMQNAYRYAVNVRGITHACRGHSFDFTMSIGFLRGDVNGDERVNSADITLSRNRSGQTMTEGPSGTFLYDVNVDGAINAGDTVVVRNSASTFLP